MAINSGRYVVTGGYMDANGNIVEEKQWVPNTFDTTAAESRPVEDIAWLNSILNNSGNTGNSTTTSNAFSPAETYKFASDGYYNLGDTNMGDAYKALWSGSNAYSNTANQINSFYNTYGSDIAKREMALAGLKSDLANKLYEDMSQQRQYVLDAFGPEGYLTKEINNYYGDLSNYLSSSAGREAAKIAAQGIHSGASLGAIRAQQNEAYNEAFERYIKAKEQEINAKQQIATNLINHMSALRQEYGNTTNQYIIQQYQRANDLLEAVSQSIANSNIELSSAKLSNSIKGSSSSSGVIIPDSIRAQYYNSLTEDQKKIFDGYSQGTRDNLIANWRYGQLTNNNTNIDTNNTTEILDVILNKTS